MTERHSQSSEAAEKMLRPPGMCWGMSFPFFEHVFISCVVSSRFPVSAVTNARVDSGDATDLSHTLVSNPSYIFLYLTQVKLIGSESQALVLFVLWYVVGSKSWVSRFSPPHISPRIKSHNKCHPANPHMLKVWYSAWHWVGAGKPVISWI